MSIISFEEYVPIISDFHSSQRDTEGRDNPQKVQIASSFIFSAHIPSSTCHLSQTTRLIMEIGRTTEITTSLTVITTFIMAITTSLIYERVSSASRILTTQNKQTPKNTENEKSKKNLFNDFIVKTSDDDIEEDTESDSEYEKETPEMITYSELGVGTALHQTQPPKDEFKQLVRKILKKKHKVMVQNTLKKVRNLESLAEKRNDNSLRDTTKEARKILTIRQESNGKVKPSFQQIRACRLTLEKAIEIAAK